jgi:hypothetical protein
MDYYKSVYQSGKYFDVNNDNYVELNGDSLDSEINLSPYLIYRINFNQSGNYSIFTNEVLYQNAKSLFIGTNVSNLVFVTRPDTSGSGFYPLASNKQFAPMVNIPMKGIHYLNLWKGSGNTIIKTIVLFKSDSLSPLILNSPSTSKVSFEQNFKTKFSVSKAGVSSIQLLWKNSKNNDSLTISESVNFVSVQLGNIVSCHPSGLFYDFLTIFSSWNFE